MNTNIFKKIVHYRNGNNNSFEEIIEIFNPILNKYSRLLNGEDTKQDLILHMLEVVNKIPIDKQIFNNDKAIFGYILKALKNKYILLSKKNSNTTSTELPLNLDIEIGYEDFESDMELLDLFKILTEKESFIIRGVYIYNLSITEIASYMNISRQAANQAKNRALKKLRELL